MPVQLKQELYFVERFSVNMICLLYEKIKNFYKELYESLLSDRVKEVF